ncbi:MAG: linear amide C-N hydrolase [Mycoplasmoidaceae bacterium]|nr:linear amide C-N hydrolase [Mycoplasmoidaceae bacterium]
MKKKSHKLSKIITPAALAAGCLATLPATSCSSMHSNIVHRAKYLHEITFDDYIYDSNFVTTKEAKGFGCSSVRNGNYYGRNFDYVFNDVPEFVVRVKANKEKKRHASIGIATHFGLHEEKLLKGEYQDQIDLIPNITLDGINDAGLICSHNVVSMEPNEVEGHKYDPQTNPENKEAKQLHMLFVPRYVLDNAATVEEAINLLTDNNVNIMGNLNGEHNLHIMIADATRTCIVEFFHKKESADHNHFDVV